MYLGLDLSTHTGWALFNKTTLLDCGIVTHKPDQRHLHPNYPINYVECAEKIASDLLGIIEVNNVDCVIIEETNQMARNRYDQKILEFIHFAINSALRSKKTIERVYLSTSQWKKLLSIKLSAEQKKHNKLVKEKKAKGKVTNKHLTVAAINKYYNLDLLIKDNDKADAIALVSAFLVKTGQVQTNKWESLNE